MVESVPVPVIKCKNKRCGNVYPIPEYVLVVLRCFKGELLITCAVCAKASNYTNNELKQGRMGI